MRSCLNVIEATGGKDILPTVSNKPAGAIKIVLKLDNKVKSIHL